MNQIAPLSMRDKIYVIEAEMKKLPQIDIPVRHYFIPGVYARQVFIPAGALVTGVTYKCAQINILSQGRIRVSVDDDVIGLEASHTVISPAGVKRVALAVTDVVWTTILHTNETDVATIEKQFFAYTEEEYQDFLKFKQEQESWLE